MHAASVKFCNSSGYCRGLAALLGKAPHRFSLGDKDNSLREKYTTTFFHTHHTHATFAICGISRNNPAIPSMEQIP